MPIFRPIGRVILQSSIPNPQIAGQASVATTAGTAPINPLQPDEGTPVGTKVTQNVQTPQGNLLVTYEAQLVNGQTKLVPVGIVGKNAFDISLASSQNGITQTGSATLQYQIQGNQLVPKITNASGEITYQNPLALPLIQQQQNLEGQIAGAKSTLARNTGNYSSQTLQDLQKEIQQNSIKLSDVQQALNQYPVQQIGKITSTGDIALSGNTIAISSTGNVGGSQQTTGTFLYNPIITPQGGIQLEFAGFKGANVSTQTSQSVGGFKVGQETSGTTSFNPKTGEIAVEFPSFGSPYGQNVNLYQTPQIQTFNLQGIGAVQLKTNTIVTPTGSAVGVAPNQVFYSTDTGTGITTKFSTGFGTITPLSSTAPITFGNGQTGIIQQTFGAKGGFSFPSNQPKGIVATDIGNAVTYQVSKGGVQYTQTQSLGLPVGNNLYAGNQLTTQSNFAFTGGATEQVVSGAGGYNTLIQQGFKPEQLGIGTSSFSAVPVSSAIQTLANTPTAIKQFNIGTYSESINPQTGSISLTAGTAPNLNANLQRNLISTAQSQAIRQLEYQYTLSPNPTSIPKLPVQIVSAPLKFDIISENFREGISNQLNSINSQINSAQIQALAPAQSALSSNLGIIGQIGGQVGGKVGSLVISLPLGTASFLLNPAGNIEAIGTGLSYEALQAIREPSLKNIINIGFDVGTTIFFAGKGVEGGAKTISETFAPKQIETLGKPTIVLYEKESPITQRINGLAQQVTLPLVTKVFEPSIATIEQTSYTELGYQVKGGLVGETAQLSQENAGLGLTTILGKITFATANANIDIIVRIEGNVKTIAGAKESAVGYDSSLTATIFKRQTFPKGQEQVSIGQYYKAINKGTPLKEIEGEITYGLEQIGKPTQIKVAPYRLTLANEKEGLIIGRQTIVREAKEPKAVIQNEESIGEPVILKRQPEAEKEETYTITNLNLINKGKGFEYELSSAQLIGIGEKEELPTFEEIIKTPPITKGLGEGYTGKSGSSKVPFGKEIEFKPPINKYAGKAGYADFAKQIEQSKIKESLPELRKEPEINEPTKTERLQTPTFVQQATNKGVETIQETTKQVPIPKGFFVDIANIQEAVSKQVSQLRKEQAQNGGKLIYFSGVAGIQTSKNVLLDVSRLNVLQKQNNIQSNRLTNTSTNKILNKLTQPLTQQNKEATSQIQPKLQKNNLIQPETQKEVTKEIEKQPNLEKQITKEIENFSTPLIKETGFEFGRNILTSLTSSKKPKTTKKKEIKQNVNFNYVPDITSSELNITTTNKAFKKFGLFRPQIKGRGKK